MLPRVTPRVRRVTSLCLRRFYLMRFNAEFAAYLLSRTDLDILVVPLLQMLCVRFLSAHCTALHCTALHCTALHCTALHCTALHCTAIRCGTHTAALRPIRIAPAAWHSTAQHSASFARRYNVELRKSSQVCAPSLSYCIALLHRSQSALCTVHSG